MKISFWLKIVFFVVVFFSTFAFYSRVVFGASIVIDSNSVGNIFNGVNSFSSGSFNFSSMNPAMLPATYDSINQYLYSNFGYDVNDAIDYGSENLTGFATGQVSNPINGADLLPSATANFVADVLGAGMTAQMVIENGYQYFAQSVPQWGENAKQFFLGKVDEVTGAITDVGSSVVTKVTAQGLTAYNSIKNSLIEDNVISDGSSFSPVYSYSFAWSGSDSTNGYVAGSITTDHPIFYFSDSSYYNRFTIALPSSLCYVESGSYRYDGVSGYGINSVGARREWYYFSTPSGYCHFETINGVEYIFMAIVGDIRFPSSILYGPMSRSEVVNLLSNDYASSYNNSYDYSANFQQALQSQLDRLLDKYIDSLTLQRINDIIDSIPLGIENVDGVSIPVAIPTDDIIAQLTAIIDDAIENSALYDDVFGAYYDDAIDTPITPDPPIEDSDIYVPIEVPITPINTIGSALTVPFMFSSIFEPIFLAFGGGLFSLWLFVPTLIIFVAILWAIK